MLLDVTFASQKVEDLVGERDLAKLLAGAKGQLKRGAGDVVAEQQQVVGVDQRMLGAAAKEVVRVSDDVLVQRAGRGH